MIIVGTFIGAIAGFFVGLAWAIADINSPVWERVLVANAFVVLGAVVGTLTYSVLP